MKLFIFSSIVCCDDDDYDDDDGNKVVGVRPEQFINYI